MAAPRRWFWFWFHVGPVLRNFRGRRWGGGVLDVPHLIRLLGVVTRNRIKNVQMFVKSAFRNHFTQCFDQANIGVTRDHQNSNFAIHHICLNCSIISETIIDRKPFKNKTKQNNQQLLSLLPISRRSWHHFNMLGHRGQKGQNRRFYGNLFFSHVAFEWRKLMN